MKIAVFSDIHDNEVRLAEMISIIASAHIEIGICCGDVASIETLEQAAKPFKLLYLALGNADFKLAGQTGLIPENVKYFERIGAFELGGKKVAIVHKNDAAEKIAESGIYDIVFYGHTHTPWEKKIKKTIILNPGEVAGQFGPASFCIYDTDAMKGKLHLLK